LIDLSGIRQFVLDEADRMLDMGFINDVKKVISHLPTARQTMLFSATMPAEIASLASSILIDPVRIAVVPVETTLDAIEQHLYFVAKKHKTPLLCHLLEDSTITSALVFSRTKHGANKIVKELDAFRIPAEAIHGNKSQSARQAALSHFKNKELRVLVATDIAARGLDIDHLSHVVNYDLPEVPETYIHRIGRTGRAGLEGISLSFCSEEEVPLLKDIEKHIKKPIPVEKNHPYAEVFTMTSVGSVAKKPQKIEPKTFSRYDAKSHTTPKPQGSSSPKPANPAPKPVTSGSVQNRYVPKKPVYHTPKPKNPTK
jgi:ATP-dependent RNA helicase RhlE